MRNSLLNTALIAFALGVGLILGFALAMLFMLAALYGGGS
jgi:hypothetical protein